MKHSVNPDDLLLNEDLNDIKVQLIEEGMENYTLRQENLKLKHKLTTALFMKDFAWLVVVLLFIIGLVNQ